VWAAGVRSLEPGVKGWLQLTEGALVFTAEHPGEDDLRIPWSSIGRVRRVIGSPVMVVQHGDDATAFYFVQPPPVVFRNETSRRPKDRLQSMVYLTGRNSTKRREVKEWVRRVRHAASSAGL